MIIAKPKQIIVLGSNIDSPNRNQVKIGNTMIPAEEPMNLAVQADPVSSTIILQAYQKAIEVGTPNNMAADKGRSFHHSDKYCAFNWNQPLTCPKNTKNIPRYIINVPTDLILLSGLGH